MKNDKELKQYPWSTNLWIRSEYATPQLSITCETTTSPNIYVYIYNMDIYMPIPIRDINSLRKYQSTLS